MSSAINQQKNDVQEALDLERIGQFGPAAAILTECVRADLANLEVLQAFLRNLGQCFETQRDQLPQEEFLPVELKQLSSKKNSFGLLLAVPRFLAKNPFHVPTLFAAADACAQEGMFDHELAYLEFACQAAPRNSTVLRRCANVLEECQDYGGALSCWRRIEALRPDEDEAGAMIVRLTIAECRDLSGIFYQASEPTAAAAKSGEKGAPVRTRRKQAKVVDAVSEEIKGVNAKLRHVPMQTLECEIAENPATAENYLRLAAIYLEKGREYDAEGLLAKGRIETHDDKRVGQLWEDLRIRRLDAKIALTKKHLEIQNVPEKREQLEALLEDRNRLETEAFSRRTELDPENAALHFELGLRLQRSGTMRTAAHHFKKALADPAQICAAAFEIGECLRQSGEFQEALRYYRMTADASSESDQIATKAQALFRAAEIVENIKLFRLAHRFLTSALHLDPNHREAIALLQKIEKAG